VEREGIPRVCIYHLVYSGRGVSIKGLDLSPEERRAAVRLAIDKTMDLHRRGTSREVLTVDNHADAAFLYRWVEAHLPERVQEVRSLLERNGGNSSGVGIGCVDNVGMVHPDQFWHHYTLGNVKQRPFSEVWEDTSDPVKAGLKDRLGLLPGRCRGCAFLGMCNGNMRVRAEAVSGNVWGEDPACYLTDEEIGLATAARAG